MERKQLITLIHKSDERLLRYALMMILQATEDDQELGRDALTEILEDCLTPPQEN
jgi:hypothetical protein